MTAHPSRWLRKLGPGVITGAADDDPSGIATYSQAGAQFGFALGWTVVLTLPLMIGIQMISARIGRVTGHGLASNIRRHYPAPVLYAVVALLFVANTINVAADIAAMAESVHLVAGGPTQLYAVAFGALCLGLEVFMSYRRYVRYLKWLTLALFAYVGVVLSVDVSWGEVLAGIALPRMNLSGEAVTLVVAIFGTTISPYLFFWQAAQEVEDGAAASRTKRVNEASTRRQLRRIEFDTIAGMTFSNLIALAIIVSAAATLHPAGITHIETSAQAAEALRPIAGPFAFVLFCLGIVGTGMLAVPVLAGSAAYAVAETFRWKHGLDLKPHQARGFYAVVALATAGGVALNFTGIDPIRALVWAAVINGVAAVPIMAVMMLLATNPRVLGKFTVRRWLEVAGWLAMATMTAAVGAMLIL
ncbi:MAG TPA: Nramp family divalent metal transporter [Casimicrobiaceae bacterium]|nr:Nramp family divalent metal transporter [Casimicrobiaceae bacterium]